MSQPGNHPPTEATSPAAPPPGRTHVPREPLTPPEPPPGRTHRPGEPVTPSEPPPGPGHVEDPDRRSDDRRDPREVSVGQRDLRAEAEMELGGLMLD